MKFRTQYNLKNGIRQNSKLQYILKKKKMLPIYF